MAQRTNQDWLDDLQASGERNTQALADLRVLILDGIHHALHAKIPLYSPDFEHLANKILQRTLVEIKPKLTEFNNRCKFSTWVHKLTVRQALLELRLHQWRAIAPERNLPEITDDLHDKLAKDVVLHRFHQIMAEELTYTQRLAIRSMVMFRMPKEEVARYLGIEFCDYFRMIHDARLRMKRRLQTDGWLPFQETTDK